MVHLDHDDDDDAAAASFRADPERKAIESETRVTMLLGLAHKQLGGGEGEAAK